MLIYLIVGIALTLSVILALRAIIGYAPLLREGKQEYRLHVKQGLTFGELTEAQYAKAYRRFHGPRSAVYACLTLVVIALMTAPLLGLLSLVFEYGWRLGGQQRTFEPGHLVWQFMLFMGMIAGWALIGFIGARLYYKKAHMSFDNELRMAQHID